MNTRNAPVRLQFATLLMLSLATCGSVAMPPEAQEKPSPRLQQRAQVPQASRACVRDVPDLSRYDFQVVRDVLVKHGLSLGEVAGQPNSAPKGTILGQSSKPGSPAKCGTAIAITVSTGPRSRDDVNVPPNQQPGARCQVPDLTKLQLDDVRAELPRGKWSIGNVHPQESPAKPGTILKQSPKPGLYEKCDWSIDVLVAVPIPVPPHPQDPPRCKVPDFTGLHIKDALGKVKGAGLGVESVVPQQSPAPADTVIAQSEKPGTVLPCDSRLVLSIATPPPPPQIQYCDVPDARGADVRVAQQAFAAAGLKVGGAKPENSFDHPRDAVITQSLKAGSQVPCGSAVYLRVSAGPALCDVPNLEAVDLAGARRVLKERGFQLGRVDTQISERIADTVLGQHPPANSQFVCNSAVDVLIAVPMPPVQVPALQGQDTDSARRTLARARLTLGSVERRFSDVTAGLVIDQQPVVDTPVQRGSPVHVWVSDGPAPRLVPDLRGRDRGDVAKILAARRFRLGEVIEQQHDAPLGTIIGQQPAAGSLEPVETIVKVWAAVPVVIFVPPVIGKRENDAVATLANHRLRVGAIETRPSTEPRATVIGQRPAAGQQVAANASVDLLVAAPIPAPPPPPPPETPRPETPPPAVGTPPGPPSSPVVAPPAAGGGSTTNAEQPRAFVTPAAPAVPVPAVPEVAVSQLPVQAPPATVDNPDPPPPAPVLKAIPNVVGSSAAQASSALREAGFFAGALNTTPSTGPAGTVTSQQPAAGQPAVPGTQVALEIAVPLPSTAILPMWWVLLGIAGGAAAAVLIAKMLRRVPSALPPSVTLEPHADTNMALTLTGDGPLVRSELWLKACPDAGVQTAHGAGPFGMMEITESR